MKKIISILLILTLFAPFWLTFTFYHIEKQIVRKKVKKLLVSNTDKKDLVLLKFCRKDINEKLVWEHSKEFEFNNIMYDIISSNEFGDSVYYWCWQDDEETNLNKRFSVTLNFTLQKDNKTNKYFTQLTNILSLQYFSNLPNFLVVNFTIKLKYFSLFLNFYESIFNCPNSPPPNFLYCYC